MTYYPLRRTQQVQQDGNPQAEAAVALAVTTATNLHSRPCSYAFFALREQRSTCGTQSTLLYTHIATLMLVYPLFAKGERVQHETFYDMSVQRLLTYVCTGR